jgi:EmrB/QacA subfamily drug resistance transporter
VTTAPDIADRDAGSRRWVALGILAAGLSMIVLDGTIVGVAMPRVITDLSLSLEDAQWVNSLYAMVFAALLLAFGRLADRVGRRTVFVAGLVVFVLGSLAAAAADGASALITARAVQGVGGAMILPTTLSSVNAMFRGKDRAVAFGVWGAVMAGMAAVGPLLGGWLTTSFDWRWIFWVNLPVGAAVLIGAVLWVPQSRGLRARPGVDVDGLLTSAAGFGLIVFGLIEGHTLGWWAPAGDFTAFGLTWPSSFPISVVPVALTLGVGLLALFALWERHRARNGRDALLDLRLLGIPTFTWGNLTALAVAAGEFALVFVLPLYLVNALGLGIMGAGCVLAAMAAGAFASGAQARHLATRFNPPAVVVIGLVLELTGVLAAVTILGPRTAPWLIAATLTVYGIGLGLASAQLTGTVLADVPLEQSGAASATQSTVRQVGSALGTAVAGTALAAGLGAALPTALATVRGLPADVAAQLVTTTTVSAGGVIDATRAHGTHGPLGALGPDVVNALASGFADATRISILAAAAFLAAGLLGAWRVAVVARDPARSEQMLERA